jgi:hypothetical protein
MAVRGDGEAASTITTIGAGAMITISRWHRLRCSCGAAWQWFGRDGEAAALCRLWQQHHRGPGHRVSDG